MFFTLPCICLTSQGLKLAEAWPRASKLYFHSIRQINVYLHSGLICRECIQNAFTCSNSFNPLHFPTFLPLIKEDDLIRVSAESSPVVSKSPFDTLVGRGWLALIISPIQLLCIPRTAAEATSKSSAACFETCQEIATCQQTWQQWQPGPDRWVCTEQVREP